MKRSATNADLMNVAACKMRFTSIGSVQGSSQPNSHTILGGFALIFLRKPHGAAADILSCTMHLQYLERDPW